MLRNFSNGRTVRIISSVLNGVLSLNAQEFHSHGPVFIDSSLLNEVLSLNAQEFVYVCFDDVGVESSMKS